MSKFDWSETKMVIGILLILVTGFWGLVITFSDSPTEWSTLRWAAYIAAWHIPSALVVGYLRSPRWTWGIAVGWGALLMLVSYFAVAAVMVVLAALVITAYGGGRIASRAPRKS